jgi:uncharacterized membrane protein YbhN (UPF0104 family)
VPDESAAPGIASVLDVLGWLIILLSVLSALLSFITKESDALSTVALSVGGCIIGILVLGLSTVLKKLTAIEHRLKMTKSQSAEKTEV